MPPTLAACLCRWFFVRAPPSPPPLLLPPLLQVPVKERAGHFVMTYHMDVRTEPVESLLGGSMGKQQGQSGTYSPMGQWDPNSRQQEVLERAMANGRVPANAW